MYFSEHVLNYKDTKFENIKSDMTETTTICTSFKIALVGNERNTRFGKLSKHFRKCFEICFDEANI